MTQELFIKADCSREFVMSYELAEVYGCDKEVSANVIKDSKIPFDLLRELAASNVYLFCEYAIATKGVPAAA